MSQAQIDALECALAAQQAASAALVAAISALKLGMSARVAAPATVDAAVLAHIKTTTTHVLAGNKTSVCMKGKHWGYRDPDIDNWLPANQHAQPASSISAYQLQNENGTTLREMAEATLNVGADTHLSILAKALKDCGHTLTLLAIEDLVERQEAGEDVGLRTDGYGNFAFIEDADGGVSVLNFSRSGARWSASVNRLGSGVRWVAENRLLLRNSVPSNL